MCEHHANQEIETPVVAMQACDACGIERPADDLASIGNDHYCADCRDNYEECCNCSTAVATDDQVTDNNRETWCRDCYGDHFTICDNCSVELPIDDAVMTENRHYAGGRRTQLGPFCQECYDDRFIRCESCSCEVSCDDSMSDDDGNSYCSDCYCERYTSCDECGCTLDCDQAISTDNGTYCEDCAPHDRESVDVPYVAADKTGFLTRRAFAVELEVIDGGRSECDMADDGWECTTDGSLQDSAGREYCSGPLGGQKGIDRINQAASHLSDGRAVVSKKCGFHLHIDASSENGATVARFMRLAKRLEQWALATQPKSRTTGSHAESYCDKLNGRAFQASTENDLEYLVYGQKTTRNAKSNKYNDARYCWMNGHSWFYRGTVECRLHAGTVNSEKILRWSEFWLHAFEFAKKSSTDDIDQVPTDATAGFWLIEKMNLPVATAAYFAERIQKFSAGRRSRSYDPDQAAENAEVEAA